jgi:hypothetical protein
MSSAQRDTTDAYNLLVQRLQTTLLSYARERGETMRLACQELLALPAPNRSKYVVERWGQAVLNKVEPILDQLQILEVPQTK